ncbi:hypothetical protein V1517DRAFT_194233 [Lipomyces orientalis]|uniref:Uncharacterized protein n=1 Tax=Lipomyces orientalis TaxID=1233043 RepID=A0ACC3TI85_9ASCO
MSPKHACDCCIVRKIRCNGQQPCESCHRGDMTCTYLTPRLKRGPRRLRSRTMANIKRRQGKTENEMSPSVSNRAQNVIQARGYIDLDRLQPVLEAYRQKLYPIWPVVAIDDLNHVLEDAKDKQNPAMYGLVLSLCAATMARLKLAPCDAEGSDGGISGDVLANEAIRARMEYNYLEDVDEHSVLTSFFLHCYFSNLPDRQRTSLVYIREAVTFAQLLRLHEEETYIRYTEKLAQRIRTLYFLVLVTERGHCIPRELPVVLDSTISLPLLKPDDSDFFLLAGFLNLVQIFIGPEKTFFDSWKDHRNSPYSHNFLVRMQDLLGSMDTAFTPVHESQKVDVIVTHSWMRVLLWQALIVQASLNRVQNANTSLTIPASVAQVLLTTLSQVSRDSLEIHGPGMTTKLLEISNALADVVICMNSSSHLTHWQHLLHDLSDLILSLPCRDGKARDTVLVKLATALRVNKWDIPRAIRGSTDDPMVDNVSDQLVVEQHNGELDDGDCCAFRPVCTELPTGSSDSIATPWEDIIM